MTGVWEHWGINRKTFYKWYERYQAAVGDFHGLKDHWRRPHNHPRSVPKPVVERIVALRRYLAQEEIRVRPPQADGVYRVLQRQGLVQRRRSRPRKKP